MDKIYLSNSEKYHNRKKKTHKVWPVDYEEQIHSIDAYLLSHLIKQLYIEHLVDDRCSSRLWDKMVNKMGIVTAIMEL